MGNITLDSGAGLTGRTPATYARSMLLLVLLYAALAALFFFYPDHVVSVLNIPPSILRFAEPLPASSERFWSTLAATGALSFALLSLLSARSPHITGYAVVHSASKALTSVVFGYLFFRERPYFAFLAAAVVDGSLALFVFWKAIFARPKAEPQPIPVNAVNP